VSGFGFRVPVSGFRVLGSGFRVSGSGIRDSSFRVSGSRFWGSGVETLACFDLMRTGSDLSVVPSTLHLRTCNFTVSDSGFQILGFRGSH
jgi:hypothetical protein